MASGAQKEPSEDSTGTGKQRSWKTSPQCGQAAFPKPTGDGWWQSPSAFTQTSMAVPG